MVDALVAGPPSIPQVPLRSDAGWAAKLGPLLFLALGIWIGFEQSRGRDPLDAMGGPLVPYAWGAVWGSPGIVGLLATRRRPALLLASALMGAPVCMLLFPVGALLAISPVLCFVAYERRSGTARGRVPDPLVAVVCLLGGIASLAALMLHQDARSFATANASGSTSDIITGTEAAAALCILGLTVAIAWFLSVTPYRARS
jgi:hypothetical protein